MEFLDELSRHRYFDEGLIVVGAIIAVLGFLKVLSSSIRLVVWLLLVVVGVFCVATGMERSSMELPPSIGRTLADVIGPGKEISADSLRLLCATVNDTPIPPADCPRTTPTIDR